MSRPAGDDGSNHERIQSYEQRLDVHGSEPSFNEDGVDLTQIRESLRRTPYERLMLVQNWVESFQARVICSAPVINSCARSMALSTCSARLTITSATRMSSITRSKSSCPISACACSSLRG